ncbi:hypothetical protein FZC84_21260 [Rossellomorea vietnamensis]|uniref:Uncharacterized protein n=1 Tax=Rossellomorea vietnamensis TaxID=218284 RepID=A0A5D4M357_9BACI|nr:hypothetical protein [Rossellomorea vietnamensis]TYR95723.1 hypothetical protein FZC84_21260 [Rossellomorea vietnamensis]
MEKMTSFGIRELHIAKYDEALSTYEAFKKLDGVQSLNVEPITSKYDLEGDDTIIETRSVLEGYTFSFENGVLDFEGLSIMEGSELTDIMDTDGTTKIGEELRNNSEDEKPYFALIGRVVGSKELKVILPMAKAESVNQSYQTKNYAIVSVSGTAIKNANGDMRILRTDGKPITDEDLTSL